VYVEDGVKPAPAPIAMPTATVEPVRDETTRAALAKLANVDAPAEPVEPEPAAAAIEPAPVPEPEPAKVETPTTDMQDAKAAPRGEPPKHAGAFDESFAESATPPTGRTMGWIAIASLCAFAGLALWKAKKRRMPDQLESLRVVSKVALGPKQQIVWLVAGDRAMLVGATEQSIALISDLGRVRNEASLDFPVAAPAPASDPTAGNKVAAFKQRLRVALSDEIAARSDAAMPEHLELLTSEPKWAQRKDTA
jgi:flagellar biogenesis protein FliO